MHKLEKYFERNYRRKHLLPWSKWVILRWTVLELQNQFFFRRIWIREAKRKGYHKWESDERAKQNNLNGERSGNNKKEVKCHSHHLTLEIAWLASKNYGRFYLPKKI